MCVHRVHRIVILLTLLLLAVGATAASREPSVSATPTSHVYLPIVARPPEPRHTLDLAGTWHYTYSQNGELPEGATWTEVDVPSFVSGRAGFPYIWFRRDVAFPAGFPRRRVYLSFRAVKFACQVYWNGTLLGEHEDGFTPFELPVPEEVLTSSNEVVVRVSNWESALAPEVPRGQVGRPGQYQAAFLLPFGSVWHWLGIWQDVTLVAYPPARIKDVFVMTSVREQQIEVEITVENLTAHTYQVSLRNGVVDGQQTALRFPSVSVSLAPHEVKTVNVDQPWAEPHLWSLDDPHLYHLRSQLSSGDEQAVRFGFREFWIHGTEFYLNGTPIHLRATAAHPFAVSDSKDQALHYLRVAKEGNNMIMRLHAQPWWSSWYEAADEVGMLIVWESAYYCYGSAYALEDARLWSRFREHLRDQVVLHRNHPSIVIWSVENELQLTSPWNYQDPRCQEVNAELAALVPFVKALDPGRPVMFEGDGDPDGEADIWNIHYPHQYPGWRQWPNEAWWLLSTDQIDMYPGEIPGWPLRKPLYVGEFLYPGPVCTEGATIFFGDQIYRDVWGYLDRGIIIPWRFQIEAYRALGVQGMCPWNIWEGSSELPNPLRYVVVDETYAPNGLYLREKNTRFFGGDTITRTAYLLNDLPHDSNLTVVWALRSGQTSLSMDSRDFDLTPAEIVEFESGLETLQVTQETLALLSYRVVRGGEQVFTYEEPVRLYPRSSLQTGGTIHVYDPAGSLLSVLAAEGILASVVNDLSVIPAAADVLVVGRDGVDDARAWRHVWEFATAGGRVLILRHERYPAQASLALQEDAATIAFLRRPSHPVLSDFREDELRYWAGDHVVIDKPLQKPAAGLYKVLIDAGSAHGLNSVGLLEREVGEGTILFSQLDLLPRWEHEPAVRKCLQNMLDYLASYHPSQPRQVQLLNATVEEQRVFDIIGFRVENLVTPPEPGQGLIFVHGDVHQPTSSPFGLPDGVQWGELLGQVEQGSVLWLHKPTASSLEQLRTLGLEIQTQATQPGFIWIHDSLRTEGMTSHSLFWLFRAWWSDWQELWHGYDFAERIFGLYGDFEGAVEYLPPAFSVDSPGAYISPDHIFLSTDGTLETEIELADTGIYNIGMLGQGTPVASIYPMVQMRLDGDAIGMLTVGEGRQIYYLTAELPAGRHRIQLEFLNDAWAPPEDRDLYFFKLLIHHLDVDQQWYPLTQPPALVEIVYGQGSILLDSLDWEHADAAERKQELVVSVLANNAVKPDPSLPLWVLEAEDMEHIAGSPVSRTYSGVWFNANGTIGADLDLAHGGRYEFRVLAGGTPLGGIYPRFELALDGRLVLGQFLIAEEERYYSVETDVAAGPNRLSLSFVNDDWAPPEDRNLYVNRIVIRKVP